MKEYLLFRFVPTMGCNYRCCYCFVPDVEKSSPETMFRLHQPHEWIKAMGLWSEYDVEFYLWGGEPFSISETYEIVKGWSEYNHVVCSSRVDTNTFYVDLILERCPTPKIKLNCSWHPEYESLDSFYDKVRRLKQNGMVGMVNFVINDENILYLRKGYCKDIDDLIIMFDDIDVFVNIAGDFNIFEAKCVFKKWKYKRKISRFTCKEDWIQLRCEKEPCECAASQHFFTVHHNGNITTCHNEQVVGNFFEGTLLPQEKVFCSKRCPCLIAYPFRLDNDLPYRNSLMAYVERNRRYREKLKRQ